MNRRDFLRSSAAPAAGAILAGATASAAPAAQVEPSPTFVDLAQAMDAAWADLVAARAAFDRAWAAAGAGPDTPDDLVRSVGWWQHLRNQERDIAGRLVYVEGVTGRDLWRLSDVRRRVRRTKPHTENGKRWRRLLPLAEAYYGEREAIQERTGVADAHLGELLAGGLTDDACRAVLSHPAANAADVWIKCRAMVLGGRTWRGREDRFAPPIANVMAHKLAAEVLELTATDGGAS